MFEGDPGNGRLVLVVWGMFSFVHILNVTDFSCVFLNKIIPLKDFHPKKIIHGWLLGGCPILYRICHPNKMGMTQHNIGNVWDYAIFIHLFFPRSQWFRTIFKICLFRWWWWWWWCFWSLVIPNEFLPAPAQQVSWRARISSRSLPRMPFSMELTFWRLPLVRHLQVQAWRQPEWCCKSSKLPVKLARQKSVVWRFPVAFALLKMLWDTFVWLKRSSLTVPISWGQRLFDLEWVDCLPTCWGKMQRWNLAQRTKTF